MSRWYVDTSAALKLVQKEPESAALAKHINAEQPTLVASRLLETEMRRAAEREPASPQETVTTFLEKVDVYEIQPATFREAGLLRGPHLRSLDALHLAAAVSIGVDAVLTYDQRMAASARDLGLRVLAPA